MRLSLYRTSASPRRQLPRRNWVKRGLIVITAAGVCLGGLAGWLWRDALLVEAIDASAQAGLRLERIEIDGRLNTDKRLHALFTCRSLKSDLPNLTVTDHN